MDNKNRKEIFKFSNEWMTYFRIIVINFKIIFSLVIYFIKQLLCGFNLFNIKKEKNIEGQLAVVTGAANGIGRGISIEIAKRHCNLAIVDIDEVNGQKLVNELKDVYKIDAKFYKVDVSIYEEVEQLKKNIEKDLGFVDILINNAGLIPSVQTLNPKRKIEDISKLIDVNLKAHIWAVRIFLPRMIERKKGHIVATVSLGGLGASAYILDYVSSKCGARYFMDGLYLDLLMKGHSDYIKTSIVCPSLVLTSNQVIKTIQNTKSDRLIYPWTPEKAGRVAVQSILKDKRYIIMPPLYGFLAYLSFVPDDVLTGIAKDILEVNQSGFEYES